MFSRFAEIAGLLVFALVMLVTSEIVLRVLGIPDSAQNLRPDLSEPHPYYRWALRPGITERMQWRDYQFDLHHTPQGFRGTDLVSEQRPEWAKSRVLMVGDSVLYGLGSADHEIFAERLKRHLPDMEIVNAGVPGYGMRQELAVVDILGEKIRPDLVVVIFRWNDLEDDLKNNKPDFAFNDAGLVVRTDVEVPETFDPLAIREALPLEIDTEDPFYTQLNLYRAAKNGVRELRDRFLPPKRRHALRGWLRLVKNKLLGAEHDRIDRPDDKARAWKINYELLKLAQARSQEVGAKLVIVSVPAYVLVNENRYGEGPREINIRIEEKMAAACAELGIEYVDLLPAMRKIDPQSEEPLYFYRDNHLAPGGNTVVADLLKDILPTYVN